MSRQKQKIIFALTFRAFNGPKDRWEHYEVSALNGPTGQQFNLWLITTQT